MMMNETGVHNFHHIQSAHCESGVAAALSTHHGLALSEPMAFGIGSGLFFAHFPFIKVMGLPLTTFRSYPGTIMKKLFSRTGIPLSRRKFRSESEALATLDSLLEQGQPAGVQLSVFWLPYLPEQFRFQFNAHHAIVCGKAGNDYVISDPIGEEKVTCPVPDFQKAWFAKGPLAPQGTLYSVSQRVDQHKSLVNAIRSGLKENSNRMLRIPFPYCGVSGIRRLAKKIVRWPQILPSERHVKLNLGQVVRMQEEIGTGGAGFRFLYAAFLQEAAQYQPFAELNLASDLMTESGDGWRSFAIKAAKMCKSDVTSTDLNEMSLILNHSAELEEKAFRQIDQTIKRARWT